MNFRQSISAINRNLSLRSLMPTSRGMSTIAIAAAVGALTMPIQAQNSTRNAANNEPGALTRDQGARRSINSSNWEVFEVDKGAPHNARGLSPRAEYGLNPILGSGIMHGDKSSKSTAIAFSMEVFVKQCRRTTIFQVFNHEGTKTDDYFMISAKGTRESGRKWNIGVGAAKANNAIEVLVDADKPFTVSVVTDNRQATVTIRQNGTDLIKNRKFDFASSLYNNREGITRFRYGAYHHGHDDANAEIWIRNASSTGIPDRFTHFRSREKATDGKYRYLSVKSNGSLGTSSSKSGRVKDWDIRGTGEEFVIVNSDRNGAITDSNGNSVSVKSNKSENSSTRFVIIRSSTRYRIQHKASGKYLAIGAGGGFTYSDKRNKYSEWFIEN